MAMNDDINMNFITINDAENKISQYEYIRELENKNKILLNKNNELVETVKYLENEKHLLSLKYIAREKDLDTIIRNKYELIKKVKHLENEKHILSLKYRAREEDLDTIMRIKDELVETVKYLEKDKSILSLKYKAREEDINTLFNVKNELTEKINLYDKNINLLKNELTEKINLYNKNINLLKNENNNLHDENNNLHDENKVLRDIIIKQIDNGQLYETLNDEFNKMKIDLKLERKILNEDIIRLESEKKELCSENSKFVKMINTLMYDVDEMDIDYIGYSNSHMYFSLSVYLVVNIFVFYCIY
jgi:hypothetical protein